LLRYEKEKEKDGRLESLIIEPLTHILIVTIVTMIKRIWLVESVEKVQSVEILQDCKWNGGLIDYVKSTD